MHSKWYKTQCFLSLFVHYTSKYLSQKLNVNSQIERENWDTWQVRLWCKSCRSRQTTQFESIYTVYMEETEIQTQWDGRCWESYSHKMQSWIILATSRQGLTSVVLWNKIQTTCPTNEPIVACSEGYIVSISFDTSDMYIIIYKYNILYITDTVPLTPLTLNKYILHMCIS